MKKHQKHAAIARSALGTFGRNEWAIMGTPCGRIQKLAFQLIQSLSDKWKVAYVDADHKSADQEKETGKDQRSAMAYGASMEYTDKITFHRFDMDEKMDVYQYRPLFNPADAVIINGNHFQGSRQIIVIDPKKEESLKRKLDRLTDVRLILLTEGVSAPYDFLQKHIPALHEVPVLQMTDVAGIAGFIRNSLQTAIPPLNGLVLAGGKSQRMGQDKGAIDYYGMPQRKYIAGLLEKYCEHTYLSCRPDQVDELSGAYPLLPDTFTGLGPMGAILSALREKPDSAWLVVACDLPLLDSSTLDYLVRNRNVSESATSFRSPVSAFPEPLVAIWEPRSYSILLQFLAQGYSCPRKALINSPVHILEAPDPDTLKNVNTKEELDEIMRMIEEKKKVSSV